MMKYRFRLDAVERIRKAERDQERGRLANAYRAEDALKNDYLMIQMELQDLREEQRRAVTQSVMEVHTAIAFQRYEDVLQSQKQALERQAAQLAEETERCQLAVIEGERGVQIMEKLDGRFRKSHELKEAREVVKQLDEVAQQRAVSQFRRAFDC